MTRGSEKTPPTGFRTRTRLWLLLILAVGLALRLTYLLAVTSNTGFVWVDPDRYLESGVELAGESGDWRWSFEAVRHHSGGKRYALPPLYPLFLSLFAMFPHYPFTAQLGQVGLATLTIFVMFHLGRSLHSDKAGLLAAGIYALWLPNIIAVWSTMQEALYLPLLLSAFLFLLWATRAGGSPLLLALSGLSFGLAALTRSMTVYFVLPAAILVVLHNRKKSSLGTRRSRPLLLAGAFLGGFALLTLPYSFALSRHLGDLTFIENHGGTRIVSLYDAEAAGEPPGPAETAAMLMRALLDAPASFSERFFETAASILHVNGGRLLQIYLSASTAWGATAWKLVSHLFADGLFIGALLLSPFGALWGQRPRLSGFIVLWILFSLFLTALSGFGGARLRAPFEPHLILLAAVVLAGGYRRASLKWLAVAALTAFVLARAVLPQLPRSLSARGDYGVDWTLKTLPKRSPMTAQAGINLLAVDGAVELFVRPRHARGSRTQLSVRLNDELVEQVTLRDREHRLRYEWPRLELVYVELIASEPKTGAPARIFLVVPKR